MKSTNDQPSAEVLPLHSVQLPDMSQAISTYWEDIADKSPGKQVTRVCTINVVVYTETEESMRYAEDAIETAAQVHPLRAILLLARSETEATDAQGQVSGYCRLTQAADIQICCEQIVLTGEGSEAATLSSSALSLLVPELPVVLWWAAAPSSHGEAFERLDSLSDKLIVDSRDFPDQVSGICQFVELAAKRRRGGFADLNWRRLTPWREATANLFDNSDHMPYLQQIDDLVIEYASLDGSESAQAILFAGWMASRLNWTPVRRLAVKERGRFDITAAYPDGRPIELRIIPRTRKRATPGNLVLTELRAGSVHGKFRLTCSEDGSQINTTCEVKGIKSSGSVEPNEIPELGRLLVEELDVMSSDSIYYQSLSAGAALLADLQDR